MVLSDAWPWRRSGAAAAPLPLRPMPVPGTVRGQTAIWALAVWITLAANWPLWTTLAQLRGAPSLYALPVLSLLLIVLPGTAALLALGAWGRLAKPYWLLLLGVAAAVQHYMLAYRIVIDPTMVANVMQTDVAEARDLMSWRFARDMLLVLLPPLLWLLRVRIEPLPWARQALRNGVLVLAALAIVMGGALATYKQLAPLMRNHPQLRYLMNPLAPAWSLARYALRPTGRPGQTLVPISAGTALGPSHAHAGKPPLFVLVVGETARGDHFAFNGYPRDTNPLLRQQGVLSWHHARSCGTSTAASVPCMFSHLGKDAFEARRADHENLLDVLQAAGLAVLWVDNQGGCKGVCDRVPHATTADAQDTPRGRALCEGGECLDEMLLEGLDARIAQLPPERRARGVVVVLHPIGSHGPAYYKRSSAEAKRFQPECRNIALDRCGQSELINAFDNSIAYTDRFLGGVIDWLKAREGGHQTAMLYMSDHGESLGEYGIYLHGMPYAFAPDEQKRVALLLWPGSLAPRTGVANACLAGQLDTPVTHDNLYPTVLGLLDVQTPTYKPALDALQPCRQGDASTMAMR